MSDGRLPAHLEVSALIRTAEAAGGFATVIAKGERDAGVILILTTERGGNARLWERLPNLDGSRSFSMTKKQDLENAEEFADYLARRTARDPDSWLVELDIANAERLIAGLTR
ncbi:MAG TPA: DUF1491 family protein [Qipengyuania sp.]|nr:DUF1491 family protein [Qipengyuania sp.]